MKFFVVLCLVLIAASLPGCSHGKVHRQESTVQDFSDLLKAEGILNILNVERRDEVDATSLLVISNPRPFGEGGCVARRTDIELTKRGKDWVVKSRDSAVVVSFLKCRKHEVKDHFFAEVNSSFDEKKISRAMRDLAVILRSNNSSANFFSGDGRLKILVKNEILSRLDSVSFHGKDDVYFQFNSKELFPAILGVELDYSGDQLIGISLDDRNSYEVMR